MSSKPLWCVVEVDNKFRLQFVSLPYADRNEAVEHVLEYLADDPDEVRRWLNSAGVYYWNSTYYYVHQMGH